MQTIWAEQALTSQGWQSDVCISVDDRGVIISVEPGSPPQGAKTGILLPSPINLHSHSFQRAMAGLSEHRGPMGSDNFWTWRNLMYRFVGQLNPDDMAAISAFVQMEMLEAGFAGICEFHYVHHQPDGTPYNNIAEMSDAIIEAADQSGIGLTLLPVLYQFGGCDERPLGDGQRRFGNTPEQFGQLFDTARSTIARIGNHSNIGVAPHSLRAVSPEALEFATILAPDKPIHMHLAEQVGEVEEVRSARGRRPVEWLYENHEVNERWCLIHLTQMNEQETAAVAKSGAVAGLCPLTESSLGDGTFNGRDFIGQEGFFGIGSDSNIQISLAEELRTLEYSQRLHHRQRAILATADKSTGRLLYEGAAIGGARAAGRNSGSIKPGCLADMVALDSEATDLFLKQDDEILDSYIFAGGDRMICDVWSAGNHLVKNGRHQAREAITKNYRKTLKSLVDML